MLWVTLATILIWTEVSGQDFDIHTHHQEFVYHEDHDLLLTIYRDNCFYTPIVGSQLFQSNFTHSHLEYIIMASLEHTHGGESGDDDPARREMDGELRIHPVRTTLDAMRDKYLDRLADYHCLDKTVWELIVPEFA